MREHEHQHQRYHLPRGLRYSTLAEREEFYSREFDFTRVAGWFWDARDALNTVYAVVIGRHTHIFKKEFAADIKEPILIDEYKSYEDVRKLILRFLPEGVYYDRNHYKSLRACERCRTQRKNCWGCKNFLGQELAFDLDPENVTCPIHGTLAQKMRRHQGLAFCAREFEMVKEECAKLYEELERRFADLRITYSGRGMHIHVMDEEAKKMSKRERTRLARKLDDEGFLIDEWVTAGEMRLIRLPFSLHGMVSRVVIPLEKTALANFDPVTNEKCKPNFIRN
ncbi:MAG: DNA primase [Candidatus Micrarchaeota archaeon]